MSGFGNLPPGFTEDNCSQGPIIPTAKCGDCHATVYAGAIQSCECGCGRRACKYCIGEFEGKRYRIDCLIKANNRLVSESLTSNVLQGLKARQRVGENVLGERKGQ